MRACARQAGPAIAGNTLEGKTIGVFSGSGWIGSEVARVMKAFVNTRVLAIHARSRQGARRKPVPSAWRWKPYGDNWTSSRYTLINRGYLR